MGDRARHARVLAVLALGWALAGCCNDYAGTSHACSCRNNGMTVKSGTYCVEGDPTDYAAAMARNCETRPGHPVDPCDSCSCGPSQGECSGERCPKKSVTEPDAGSRGYPRSSDASFR